MSKNKQEIIQKYSLMSKFSKSVMSSNIDCQKTLNSKDEFINISEYFRVSMVSIEIGLD